MDQMQYKFAKKIIKSHDVCQPEILSNIVTTSSMLQKKNKLNSHIERKVSI